MDSFAATGCTVDDASPDRRERLVVYIEKAHPLRAAQTHRRPDGAQPVAAHPARDAGIRRRADAGRYAGEAADTARDNGLSVEPSCSAPKKNEYACFALRRTDLATAKRASEPAGYGAADLRSAYGLPADGGAGRTVAVVDAFDDPNAEADLAVYRQQFGLPACTTANGCFRKVDQRGGTDYPPPERRLGRRDLARRRHGVRRRAARAHPAGRGRRQQLRQPGAAVDQAVAMGAKYVSNSYGTAYTSTPGSGEDPTEVTEFDPHYNHPGVAGRGQLGDDDFGVSYPAASQYVTSVGGTSLRPRRQPPAAGRSRCGTTRSAARAAAARSSRRSRPGRPTPAARCAPSPTSPRSPTRPPASRSTRPSAQRLGGLRRDQRRRADHRGVYAVAGTPVAGTYPSSYPYANPGALNDVTAGHNGSARRPTCAPPAPATTVRPVWAPPTAWPRSRTGPHGQISGTVTDAATGNRSPARRSPPATRAH